MLAKPENNIVVPSAETQVLVSTYDEFSLPERYFYTLAMQRAKSRAHTPPTTEQSSLRAGLYSRTSRIPLCLERTCVTLGLCQRIMRQTWKNEIRQKFKVFVLSRS